MRPSPLQISLLILFPSLLTNCTTREADATNEGQGDAYTDVDNDDQEESDADADADADSDADSDADDDSDSDWAGSDTGLSEAPDTDSEEEEEEEPHDSGTPPDDTGDTGDTGAEECDTETDVTLYLSPDDSNSMSSPVQARMAALEGWGSIGSVPIRTWEFFNYYSWDYDPADLGEINIIPALQENDDGDYTLQIGVASKEIANEDRRPMNITFVMDESGSMSGKPITLLKTVCTTIAGQLKEGDIASMVVWDTSNAIVLDNHEITGADDPTLLAACNGMAAGGGTDLYGGLTAGYSVASTNFSSDMINRILLVSDGGANAGVTELNIIGDAAGDNNADGIYMVGVGVGDGGSYNDELMDAVTDAGKGASVFIGNSAEAETIFADRFVSTMDVAARDVRVKLDLPAGFQVVKFSGEEISSDPTEVEPQNLAPSDTMVFYQTLETCAPELVSDDTAIEVTVRFKDPLTFTESEETVTVTFGDLLGEDSAILLKGAAIYDYAEGLKLYQEAYTSSDRADIISAVLETLTIAEDANPGDTDLEEIRTILESL